jgi:hypothetical protein
MVAGVVIVDGELHDVCRRGPSVRPVAASPVAAQVWPTEWGVLLQQCWFLLVTH